MRRAFLPAMRGLQLESSLVRHLEGFLVSQHIDYCHSPTESISAAASAPIRFRGPCRRLEIQAAVLDSNESILVG
jgi:hypothetical protein